MEKNRLVLVYTHEWIIGEGKKSQSFGLCICIFVCG